MAERCKRDNGTLRAHFYSRASAEQFAADPGNVAYHGDIPQLCGRCGSWHLSRPEWFINSGFLPETRNLICCVCTDDVTNEDNCEFLILGDGTIIHEKCVPRRLSQ